NNDYLTRQGPCETHLAHPHLVQMHTYQASKWDIFANGHRTLVTLEVSHKRSPTFRINFTAVTSLHCAMIRTCVELCKKRTYITSIGNKANTIRWQQPALALHIIYDLLMCGATIRS